MGGWASDGRPKEDCLAVGSSLASLLTVLGSDVIVRYDKSSERCSTVARELCRLSSPTQGKRLPGLAPPVILVLDRRSDFLTPLITPWSYGPLLYELFQSRNSVIDLENCLFADHQNSKGSPAAQQQISLYIEDDTFFRENFDRNFGEIGRNLQLLLSNLRHSSLAAGDDGTHVTIESMKQIIEEYPQYRLIESCAASHVRVAEAVSKWVQRLRLLQASELEQAIVTSPPERYEEALETVRSFLAETTPARFLVFKILILFALRFKAARNFSFNHIVDVGRAHGFTEGEISVRVEPFFGNSGAPRDRCVDDYLYLERVPSGLALSQGPTKHAPSEWKRTISISG